MSGFGTKRTRSPISPRPGVEGRPEVVGAVQNDEIDPTWKSRIRRNGHKPCASFTVDYRDRFRALGPSALGICVVSDLVTSALLFAQFPLRGDGHFLCSRPAFSLRH
jgi:hypothetical protein